MVSRDKSWEWGSDRYVIKGYLGCRWTKGHVFVAENVSVAAAALRRKGPRTIVMAGSYWGVISALSGLKCSANWRFCPSPPRPNIPSPRLSPIDLRYLAIRRPLLPSWPSPPSIWRGNSKQTSTEINGKSEIIYESPTSTISTNPLHKPGSPRRRAPGVHQRNGCSRQSNLPFYRTRF